MGRVMTGRVDDHVIWTCSGPAAHETHNIGHLQRKVEASSLWAGQCRTARHFSVDSHNDDQRQKTQEAIFRVSAEDGLRLLSFFVELVNYEAVKKGCQAKKEEKSDASKERRRIIQEDENMAREKKMILAK